MSQGSSTVPPPPSGDPSVDITKAGNGGGMDRFRYLVSRLSGGGTPAIDKALDQHHAQLVADAQRHAASAKQYYGMVAKAKATGKNPLTGQPVTPEEMDTWQKQADGAWADYTKIAGKSKQAKPIIQQMGGLLKHITGSGGQAQQGSATVPPPPQGQDASASTPPQQTVSPPPGSNPLQEAATREAQDSAAVHTQAQGDLDAASQRKTAEKGAEERAKAAAKPTRAFKPHYESGKVVGIEDPNSGEFYTDPAKMPPEARAIYDSSKQTEAARDKDEQDKETRRFTHQVTLQAEAFQNALKRSDYIAAKKEVTKSRSDYDAAIDRQTTMHQNLDAGLKGDQQAMLSLVANHIGMTLGAQKGARITRAVWDEATSSAPWLEKLEAKFDSRGYLSGVKLTPDQMKQMVDLADQKVGILKDHVGRVQDEYTEELGNRVRGKTVTAPPDGKTQKIKVTAEDMANAGR